MSVIVQEAGINVREAPTIGIAVDHRRVNRCVESLQANVERLQAYKSKLVVFKKNGAVEELSQVQGEVLPLERVAPKVELMSLTPELKKQRAFMGLRQARCDARNYGRRLKRASEAEEENQG